MSRSHPLPLQTVSSRSGLFRSLAALVAVSLTAMLLTANLPHHHADGSSSLDPDHACSITKIQQSFSPSCPKISTLVLSEAVAVGQPLCRDELARVVLRSESSAPRAPPVS